MKKVVSATLAGALAVGMVPAMALADDAIELQASEEQDLLEDAQIYSFVGGLTDGQVFAKGADVTALVIDKVYVAETGKNGTYYDNDDANNGFVTKYKKIENGQPTGSWVTPNGIGFYAAYAVWNADTANEFSTFDYATFSITGASLEGIELYEVNGEDKTDLSDEVFTFKNDFFNITNVSRAADGDLALKLNGENVSVDDFSWKFYAEGYKSITGADIKNAGKYIVELTPKASSNYYGNKPVEIAFEVAPLDLNSAKVVLAAADQIIPANGRPAIVSIDDVPYSKISSLVECTYTAAASNTGVQKVTVTANAPALAASIFGSASAEYLVVDQEVTLDAKYDGKSFNDLDDYSVANHFLLVDRNVADYEEFDPAEIGNVKSTSGIDFKKDYTVSYFKKVLTTVDPTGWVASSLAEVQDADVYGTFKVVVTVNATIDGKLYAGTDEMIVKTVNAPVEDGDVTFTYGPTKILVDEDYFTNTGNGAVPYDGTDLMDGINVTVKTATGKVIPASEYSIVITKKDESANAPANKWDVVDEIVDWGTYAVNVVSTKYDIQDAGLSVVVVPAKAVPTIINQIDPVANVSANYYALYTGDEINPILGFTNKDVDNDGDGNDDAIEVPADAYKVTIVDFDAEKPADQPALTPTAVKAPGTYTIAISDVKDGNNKTVKDNYEVQSGAVSGATFTLHVTSKNVFVDVPADAWYADEVYAVAKAEWITGYGNGMFGPLDGMKRGDLALVLARYIDEDSLEALIGTTLEGIVLGDAILGVDTGFADVKGGAYYAAAVKAMDKAGIITGYGDGTYGPEDPVTRQQLATILARLDASGLTKDGETLLQASVLDAYADADEVAGWAYEGVEWAVENGIMGVDTKFLNPTDTVTRAEVAAMLVRYNAL